MGELIIGLALIFGLTQFFIAVPAAFFVTVAVLFTVWLVNKIERRRIRNAKDA